MKSSQINVRDFSLFIAIVLVWVFFSWQIPDFVSARNLSMLSIELSHHRGGICSACCS